jgi:3',5'-cyclic AMP phosphodiesterase CpdA
MPPILLLHLSDLHFGPHSRFGGESPERLGEGFHRALVVAQRRIGLPDQKVDLVLVTGDVAEAGKRSEFEDGRRFLAALAGGLGLLAGRFVFVPGNHDVNWASCKRAEAELEEREELTPDRLRRRLDEVKLDVYHDFLKRFHGVDDLSAIAEPLGRGAHLHRFPDLRLAIAALNSCEQESHRPEDHLGLVSREQAEAALAALSRGELAAWLKILAVHHNPVVTTPANLAAWRRYLERQGAFDAGVLARYESDALGLEGRDRLRAVAADAGVQLVLHGHHHAQDKQTWDWRGPGHAHVLSAGSLGLTPEVLPRDEPASARLILLAPELREIRFHSLVYTAWHRLEGSVEWGAFAFDPVGWTVQRLDLPEGFLTAAGPPAPAPQAAVDAEFLLAFRQRLRDAYTRWDIGSLGALRPGGAQGGDAPLDDMYLELRFASGPGEAEAPAGRSLHADDLLRRDRPLVLRGPAGAGKTTWARFTFNRLARDDRALPLMLVLRDVARRWQLPGCAGEERSLDAALDGWIGSQMGAGWRGRLGSLLKAGAGPRPVLLVDGWDEIGPIGAELRGKLLGFLHEHPRILAVVTSRPYGQDPPSHGDGFEILDLQPLADGDMEELTRRFFRRFASGGEAGGEGESGRFLAALRRSPEAQDLARTPLLLTMMLLVGHSQPLPDKRHLLYEKCIDALLHARPDQKAAEGALAGRHVWCPPDIDRRRRWVAALAYRVQSVKYQGRRAPIVRSWDEMATLLPDACPRDRRDGFLAWLVETAGLLADRADGTLAFAHLSFQEYLAAYHLETTAGNAAQRRAAFDQGIPNPDWWETLRLLAAQIETRNPAFLSEVLEGLLQAPASDRDLAFAGTVFADGLGPAPLFGDWQERWLASLSLDWPPGADLCSIAWLAARQPERKELLAQALSTAAAGQTWLGWQRLEAFGERWAPLSSWPSGRVARGLIGALRGEPLTSEGFAAGRVLCGLVPLWPSPRQEVAFLQVWPSRRRLAGLQLQSLLAAGAAGEFLLTLAPRIFPQPADEARDLARDLARNLARDLARGLAHDLVLDRARDLTRDLAHHLARDVALYLSPDFAHGWARQGAYSGACDWIRYLSRSWARDRADESTPDLGREWTGFAHHLASDIAKGYPPGLFRAWTDDLPLYLSPDVAPDSVRRHAVGWLEDFLSIERFSLGRVAARTLLAAGWHRGRRVTPSHLLSAACRVSPSHFLSAACRLSLRPGERSELRLRGSARLDPLWPALARHLARRSTDQDRELLVHLARHPEQREPPLQWGLRFIVRGDLLLEDGSFLTLDELADQAGIERLPFLDEMEPELEVDWQDDEEKEPPSPPQPARP